MQTPDEGMIPDGKQRGNFRQTRTPQPQKKHGISTGEKFLYCSFLAGLIILTLLSIGVKGGLSTAQQNLQNVNQTVDKIHNDNGNLKQEVSELQSSSRLQKIAQEKGLSLSNNNIRNVRK
ncbi:cell division protein FtsL [Lactobacillus sp. Sy-1]|nr:cell division protein FtsL [Lactobacillus sp. Sy-1]